MNRKNLFYGVVLLLTLGFTQPSCAQIREQTKPVNFIKAFYTNYVLKISGDRPPNRKEMDIFMNNYCTKELLQKIKDEELDEDPFIRAQDSDSSSVKTLSVIAEQGQPNSFLVSYLITNNKKIVNIHVKLVAFNTSYKIDGIR
jgi:hypothetical protein